MMKSTILTLLPYIIIFFINCVLFPNTPRLYPISISQTIPYHEISVKRIHEFINGKIALEYPPVDVVYTWVNGSDETWLRQKNMFKNIFTGNNTDIKNSASVGDNRYRSNNELKYSLRSVVKNMPWIRKVYLITANQVPSWLKPNGFITIVNHSDILPKNVLPTFNSRVIEQGIKNIESLSEYYIYMNDDVFVMKYVGIDTFMNESGHKFYSWQTDPDCNKQCTFSMLGNGICDDECNTYECAYDLGDCSKDNLGYSQRKLKDEYEQAIWNSHRLIESVFGKATFQAAMHLPLMMNKRIWGLIEYLFPHHHQQAINNRFRKWTDFQYQYTYEAFLRELSIYNTTRIDLLFLLLDENKDGVLTEIEVDGLNSTGRSNPLFFKRALKECNIGLPITQWEYEECSLLHDITRKIFSYIGKHVDESSRMIWNPQLADSIERNLEILDRINKRDLLFLCINDGMMDAADEMEPILHSFYEKTFTAKASFEI